MRIRTILIACSLIGAPALAQEDQPRPGGSPFAPEGDTGLKPDIAKPKSDTGGRMNTGHATAPMAHRDREFIDKAALSSMFEIKASELALSKTQNPTVKQFAQQMLDDHNKLSDKLKQIASAKGATLPSQLDSKWQAEYDRLSKLEGAEFDRAYMKGMVDDHSAGVAEFQKESEEGKDAELKSFARQSLPTLKHHSDMAKQERRTL